MSTVLEALRELEGQGKPGSQRLPPSGPRRRMPSIRTIAALVIAVGVGVVLTFLVRRETPRLPATRAPVAALPGAAVDLEVPPVGEAPNRSGFQNPSSGETKKSASARSSANLAEDERPWGTVHPRQPVAVAPVPEPPTKAREKPAAPADSDAGGAVVFPGGSEFILRSIDCSAGAHACRARFLIDGRLVSLAAGERSGDVEVQLVLADVAYVRQGGTVIAIHPR